MLLSEATGLEGVEDIGSFADSLVYRMAASLAHEVCKSFLGAFSHI